MTLKIVKGGKSNSESSSKLSDKGLFIIEATNTKDEVGYISDVNKKISISFKLIPQVVRYTSRKDAEKQINHIKSNIQGLKLKIIGQKRIEEILAAQDDLDLVVPVEEVKDSHIVAIYDTTTKETIGYLAYNSEGNNYFMKTSKEGIAFWDSKDHVEKFIEGAKGLISSQPNLKLKLEKL